MPTINNVYTVTVLPVNLSLTLLPSGTHTALWLLCVFLCVFFRVFFCVFSVHSSTFFKHTGYEESE